MFTIIGGDGKEYGPVSADKIRDWIAGGRANLQTPARADGETEWKTLGDFAEFAAPVLASATPPASPVEPVVEEKPLASRGARLGAAIVDMVLQGICLAPGILVLGPETFLQLAQGNGSLENKDLAQLGAGFLLLIGGGLILLILQSALLAMRSQTLGKLLLKIQIVRSKTGEPASFAHAVLLRFWLTGLLHALPLIGKPFMIVDVLFIFREDRRCVHDFLADTKVVQL